MVIGNFYLRLVSYLFMVCIFLFAVLGGGFQFALFVSFVVICGFFEAIRLTQGSNVLRTLLIAFLALDSCLIMYLYFSSLSLFLWLAISVVLVDSFAYLVGSRIGKIKICRCLSQGKTVEGFLAGLVSCMIFSYLYMFFRGHFSLVNLYRSAFWSFILTFFEQLGDMFESLAKRVAGRKDSSCVIPGHGGVLDRIDGFLFTVPLVTLNTVALISLYG